MFVYLALGPLHHRADVTMWLLWALSLVLPPPLTSGGLDTGHRMGKRCPWRLENGAFAASRAFRRWQKVCPPAPPHKIIRDALSLFHAPPWVCSMRKGYQQPSSAVSCEHLEVYACTLRWLMSQVGRTPTLPTRICIGGNWALPTWVTWL